MFWGMSLLYEGQVIEGHAPRRSLGILKSPQDLKPLEEKILLAETQQLEILRLESI
jgi:hypothetical protein